MEYRKNKLLKNIVKEKETIVGKYAACSIFADDFILTSKLSKYAANKKLDKVIGDGKKLVTVSLNSVASAVGNHLKSGDFVSIIGYADDVRYLIKLLEYIGFVPRTAYGINQWRI